MSVVVRLVALFGVWLLPVLVGHAMPQAVQPDKGELPKAPGALDPKEEQATFKLVDGLKIELVASEPEVVDPVAMCFDERGRLFVCEMRGYPNGGVGTGNETRGKIKCLMDQDGDGVFETSHTFAEGLRFPMGIMAYKDGLIVAVAPDLLYLQDTNGDGKADKTTVLYTGFNLANIQQMVNGLQWGLDNWVYGICGSDGGEVKSGEKPDAPAILLRNRGFRFHPDIPASLEPTSSGGQFGLTADDFQRWFTATNSQHLRQIVLPEHYAKRNPSLPVSAVTADIAEHGAAAKVFRISPFEPWRVERTTRRAVGTDAKRFPKTELIPGGYITSACSPLIYTGELLPKEYYGNNFVCDPANNLIHRELLRENGGAFKAVRAYPDREFLASTDNWFRPVHLTTGPDGAIYLLDFYREVIETPLSLPDDIKKQLNLESRGRGRIWRIAPTGFKPAKIPDLSKLRPSQLAAVVAHENPWQRLTAQRLLVQGKVAAAVPSLRGRLEKAQGKPARVNLLWTLEGLGALEPNDVKAALNDPLPGVRENAVRLAERWLSTDGELRKKVAELARDTSSRVRFQLALSAGGLPEEQAAAALAEVLARGRGDSWTLTAALTSASHCRSRLLAIVSSGKGANESVSSVIASMVGRGGDAKEIADAISRAAAAAPGGMEAALISGLGHGMENSKTPLGAWLTHPPAGAEKAVVALRKRLDHAVATLSDAKAAPRDRLDAAVLLTFVPLDVAEAPLAEALDPSYPVEIQVLAVRALAAHPDAKLTRHVFLKWNGYAPSVRAAAINALLLRPERILTLLDAIEKKDIPAAALSPAQIQQLKAHPNARVKAKASAVFKQVIDADRAKVIASYAKALELKGDAKSGKGVFAKNCSACHKLDGVGNDVGANLLATIGNKSGEDLLVAIFDPNREVDPRYLSYQVGTADEKVYTGVIVAETPTSITVRRAEGAQDTILRADLAFLRATSISLMPVGLEKELKPQDVADLFAYLRTARK